MILRSGWFFLQKRFRLGSLFSMSTSIDKALMAMSLEEEDKPFDMPDLPEFCSSEKNVLSIMGRLLNPDCQKMSSLILDMPRKWQVSGRVRGVALSQEKFQFIFKHQFDMERILEKGVHTYNEWAMVIDRWVENPPPDYLQYVRVWIQIRNIPVNHYTVQAITALGEIVGQVKEVILEPERPQNMDYVRVLIEFDVSKPLRRSKVVNFKGVPVNILFGFERLQKRCFKCQSLTHEQQKCPIWLKEQLRSINESKRNQKEVRRDLPKIIKESDPLFGVVEESQVGINPNTGRERIDKEVLQGMRQYLMVVEGAEKVARKERIKKSLQDLKNDLIGEKTMLRLETAPVISTDITKGKGVVFEYANKEGQDKAYDLNQQKEKVMWSAINDGSAMRWDLVNTTIHSEGEGSTRLAAKGFFQEGPTVFKAGFSEASLSGNFLKNGKPRKRPFKSRRKRGGTLGLGSLHSEGKESVSGNQEEGISKRKAADEAGVSSKVAKRKNHEVVPNEGPSNL